MKRFCAVLCAFVLVIVLGLPVAHLGQALQELPAPK